jgi:hypothetical protein
MGGGQMNSEEINLSEWYTAKQAADKLGTSPKYVRTLGIQYGKFKTHKLHEQIMLYWKEDVDAYHVERKKPGRPRKRVEGTDEKAA